MKIHPDNYTPEGRRKDAIKGNIDRKSGVEWSIDGLVIWHDIVVIRRDTESKPQTNLIPI